MARKGYTKAAGRRSARAGQALSSRLGFRTTAEPPLAIGARMNYAIPAWDIPSLAVVGSAERFPVRRIFCVGRNYVEHQKEMGGDGREQPFFFTKNPCHLVPNGGDVRYPPKTENYHWETEMVAVLASGGFRIPVEEANGHVWGYAVGLDMTRRDLQQWGKDHGRPWSFGKDFDQAAPVGPVTPAAKIGHPTKGRLWLTVNGESKQDADISMMIWSIPEQIAFLSQYYALQAGDLIMTGTPAGVGRAKPGDALVAGIDGLGELKVKILPPL
jgi:fumarylpyruvate hydrolase